MNWNYFFIGIGFLAGSFLLYRIKKWDYYKGEYAKPINRMKAFHVWGVIVMCIVTGLVFIFKSYIY